jgi:Na+/H+ antiporter NhaC
MPKKKSAKTSTKSSKSHGELFDKHPHLKWLIPVFFVVCVVAIYILKVNADNNMQTYVPELEVIEVAETENTTNETTNTTNTTDSGMGY